MRSFIATAAAGVTAAFVLMGCGPKASPQQVAHTVDTHTVTNLAFQLPVLEKLSAEYEEKAAAGQQFGEQRCHFESLYANDIKAGFSAAQAVRNKTPSLEVLKALPSDEQIKPVINRFIKSQAGLCQASAGKFTPAD